jgi:hypothetical protein
MSVNTALCSEVDPHTVSTLTLAQQFFAEEKYASTVGVVQ